MKPIVLNLKIDLGNSKMNSDSFEKFKQIISEKG